MSRRADIVVDTPSPVGRSRRGARGLRGTDAGTLRRDIPRLRRGGAIDSTP
ncbi:hypothetical protein [uncultured Microbacterium sp.]|uniref:hypothetical protein n=1 Tax=uncultured Microbacterium sp. TaxID=191216 RepID=UPI002612DFE5|nr:hypothetical protein [uncultured Microbacterium sp.]